VTDAATRRPIPGVNLRIEGGRLGTTTDKKGAFSFFTDSLPAKLTFTHVGYETRNLLLDETSYSLAVYLKPKPLQLEEVEIRAARTEPFYKSETFSVLDYELDSGRVWMVVYRQRLMHSLLICLDIYGDTLARSADLPFRPVSLFRDCIGTMHVLGHDSGYQIYLREKKAELIHPVKLKKFESVLKNCVAASPTTLYFRKVTENGLSVEFYGVDRTTLVHKDIQQVTDRQKLRMKRRNSDDAMLLNSSHPPVSRDDFVTWNYVHKILYRPVKTKLYLSGMYVCIFNMPDKSVEFYDSLGNYSYKLRLLVDAVNVGRWTQEAEADPVTGKVYTFFNQGGRYTMYEINPDTGALTFRLTFDFVYPEKIRVYNGWVYYMYDKDSRADNKALYRQR
jgi:hypothetical protein